MVDRIFEEQRIIIKFCLSLGHSPAETKQKLDLSFGEHSLSQTTAYEWYRRFQNGRGSPKDNERSGRPCVVNELTSIKDALDGDRRMSTRDIADMFDIGVATAHSIITKDLGMVKVCARWIPRLLTDKQKNERVLVSEEFLRRYRREGERFFNRIITTDESWFYQFDPETKAQSSVWKHSSSPPPKKARVVKSKAKHMFIVFMDIEGVILLHAVPEGVTVNAAYYSKVL